jgi:hypothetical protein
VSKCAEDLLSEKVFFHFHFKISNLTSSVAIGMLFRTLLIFIEKKNGYTRCLPKLSAYNIPTNK